MHTQTKLIAFPDYVPQTQRLAEAAKLPAETLKLHSFPDAEVLVTLPATIPRHVILCRSLHQPNAKLIELMLAAQGAREAGAQTVSLIAPYLCYMRQDTAFHPGEVVSQRIIGQWLANYFDNVLTVDAHLHRIHRLSDAIPVHQAINLTATAPMAAFLRREVEHPFLVGPDSESEQWVAAIAAHDHWDYAVGAKKRLGDRQVEIHLPQRDYSQRHIVLVDDVASTGQTLLQAARALHPFAPASISVLVTHALFVGDALAELEQAGVRQIWSCDSIPHATNAVSLATQLADALQQTILAKEV